MKSHRNKTIGVYLGSTMGSTPDFAESIILLGKGLASQGYTLVYGGASVGLMGLLAQTVKDSGGSVIGVLTEHLQKKEITFQDADEMHIVSTMYERKKLIHDLSSRFIVFPGGLGTFDELFETWCGIKIGTIQKKIGFINIQNFFDPLFQFMSSCEKNGFMTTSQLMIPAIYKSVAHCLADLNINNEVNVI